MTTIVSGSGWSWGDAAHTWASGTVTFDDHGEQPYDAYASDTDVVGAAVWAAMIAGTFGTVTTPEAYPDSILSGAPPIVVLQQADTVQYTTDYSKSSGSSSANVYAAGSDTIDIMTSQTDTRMIVFVTALLDLSSDTSNAGAVEGYLQLQYHNGSAWVGIGGEISARSRHTGIAVGSYQRQSVGLQASISQAMRYSADRFRLRLAVACATTYTTTTVMNSSFTYIEFASAYL